MISAALLEEKVQSSTDSGASCTFVKINNEVGLKVYTNHSACNDAYFWQNIYYAYDIAPKPGKMVRIGDYWCYTTEIIETFHQRRNKLGIIGWTKTKPFFRETKKKAEAHMADIGIEYTDSHMGNWGFRDGEDHMVPLDFDLAYWENGHIIVKTFKNKGLS